MKTYIIEVKRIEKATYKAIAANDEEALYKVMYQEDESCFELIQHNPGIPVIESIKPFEPISNGLTKE